MNYNDGNIFLLGDVDDNVEANLVVPMIREIQRQRLLRDGTIDIYINSVGGSAETAFQIISLIEMAKREDITVRTIVQDAAYSAGSAIAVAGSPGERYIEKGARHLVHYGFGGSGATSPEHLQRISAYLEEHFNRIYKHYQKYSKVPDLKNMMRIDDYTIPAADCIKYGLADKYLDKFDVGYE